MDKIKLFLISNSTKVILSGFIVLILIMSFGLKTTVKEISTTNFNLVELTDRNGKKTYSKYTVPIKEETLQFLIFKNKSYKDFIFNVSNSKYSIKVTSFNSELELEKAFNINTNKEQLNIIENFVEGYSIFEKDEKQGWVRKDGTIINEGFDKCYPFQEGFAIFKINEKYGFVDYTGNILDIKENKGSSLTYFDELRNFNQGYSVFKKDNKVGIIDTKGTTLINGLDYCEDLDGDYFYGKKEGKDIWIDVEGIILYENPNN